MFPRGCSQTLPPGIHHSCTWWSESRKYNGTLLWRSCWGQRFLTQAIKVKPPFPVPKMGSTWRKKLYSKVFVDFGVQFEYSVTYFERPLLWETTCLEGPPVLRRRSYIVSVKEPVTQKKTTCLERHFYGQWGGLSRQALLYSRKRFHCTNITLYPVVYMV